MLLALSALFFAPPAHAAPAAPQLSSDLQYVEYFGGAGLNGSKPVGTVIESRAGGRQPRRVQQRVEPGLHQLRLFPRQGCVLAAHGARPGPGSHQRLRRGRIGARSPATEITLVFEESRLAITTPDRLPSGDVITLEGEREYSTTIEWQLEGSTGLVFSGRQCTLPDDVENRIFSCVYDSTRAAPRASRPGTPLLRVVPDGELRGDVHRAPGHGHHRPDLVSVHRRAGHPGDATGPTRPAGPAGADRPDRPDPAADDRPRWRWRWWWWG